MMTTFLVILGGILILVGSLDYVVDILKSKIQPNRLTWFLWSLAPLIAFFAEIKQGVGLQSIMTLALGFSTLLVFLTSFINQKANWSVNLIDVTCGLLSLCGLTLWMIAKTGNLAIIFSILADELAVIPVVIKSYTAPETESYKVFLLTGIGAILTLLTVRSWHFVEVAFPINTLSIEIVLVALIKFKAGVKVSNFIGKIRANTACSRYGDSD